MSVFNFDRFAQTYDAHRHVGGPYVPVLARLAAARDVALTVELGCGTGNSTAGFLEAHPCRVVGCDVSMPMLRKAQAKSPAATFANADVLALPVGEGVAHMAFGVLMLQHVSDHVALVEECRRVLRDGGVLAFVTAPYEFIHDHFLNAYFPSFAAIDAPRFGHEYEMMEKVRMGGFRKVSLDYVQSPAVPVDAAYLEKVRGRFISTLQLLPDDEFEEGLTRLESDIAAHGGQLPQPIAWRAVVISGHRAP